MKPGIVKLPNYIFFYPLSFPVVSFLRRNHPLKIETIIFSVVRLIEGEVFLVWDGGEKMKSQKDLAKGVKLKLKDDMKVLDYYRWI